MTLQQRTPLKRTSELKRTPIKRKKVMPFESEQQSVGISSVTGAVKAAPKKRKPKPKGPTKTQYKAWCDQLAGAICRSEGACARCGSSLYLQWSHRVPRGYFATRWDENNCDPMCRGCHYWQHQNVLENEQWLASRGVDLLAIKHKALTHAKPDYPATFARLIERADELGIPTEKFKKHLSLNH